MIIKYIDNYPTINDSNYVIVEGDTVMGILGKVFEAVLLKSNKNTINVIDLMVEPTAKVLTIDDEYLVETNNCQIEPGNKICGFHGDIFIAEEHIDLDTYNELFGLLFQDITNIDSNSQINQWNLIIGVQTKSSITNKLIIG